MEHGSWCGSILPAVKLLKSDVLSDTDRLFDKQQ
jgi:hypothetical protein